MASWRERESERRTRSRQTNESTALARVVTPAAEHADSFVCECGDRACSCAIGLTLAEYESVREYATHFVVAPNHENPESESVVEENERFTVVEAVGGEAVKLARRSDPRETAAGTSARRPGRFGRPVRG
jgi:hypothetical protein